MFKIAPLYVAVLNSVVSAFAVGAAGRKHRHSNHFRTCDILSCTNIYKTEHAREIVYVEQTPSSSQTAERGTIT